MSYTALIQSSARLAFSIAGDILYDATYILDSNTPGYDPENGAVVDDQQSFTIKIVEVAFGTMQRSDPSLTKEDFTGKKVVYVLKGDQVGELPFEPRSSDLIIMPNSDKLKIVGIRSDPTNVLYTLLLDRP